jgi:hypothetical protein
MDIVINLSAIPTWIYWVVGIVIYAWIGRMISCFYARRQRTQDLIFNNRGCGKPCCSDGICGKDDHRCRWFGANTHDIIGDGYKIAKVLSIFAWPAAIALNLVVALFLTSVNNGWRKSYDAANIERQKQLKAETVAKATKGQKEFAEREAAAKRSDGLSEATKNAENGLYRQYAETRMP